MPNIVLVVKIHQNATLVPFSRFSSRNLKRNNLSSTSKSNHPTHRPQSGGIEEEHGGGGPGGHGKNAIDASFETYSLTVDQLH